MLYRLLILSILITILIGCDNESGTENTEASIYGKVTFLDGTPVADAEVRLIVLQSNQNRFTTTDNNGSYRFDNLFNSSYQINFISQSYEVNSYRSPELPLSRNSIEHNFKITYSILDDFKSSFISDSVVLMQFQPAGAKIGNNFSAVSNLQGYYRPAEGDDITLECDVYEMPVNVNWSDTTALTPTNIKENFTYLMSLSDTKNNFRHTLEIKGNDIPKILSNPANGFAFIKRTNDEAVLKIPCIDFNNNDFGLVIKY